ncbi:MAG: helix-turn-helix domain-containing protein [Gracilibacteraceae bacterium]|nr:helix-turn-helix domain-containing protein [Gracilibacteraceae bacterium]
MDYLHMLRIDESKKLMRDQALSLYDISGLVGYAEHSYFTKTFKKWTDMTPQLYRTRLEQGRNKQEFVTKEKTVS